MKLTTILNLKKLARSLLLYRFWPAGMKQAIKNAKNSIFFWLISVRSGLKVETNLGQALLAKGERKIVVPAHTLRQSDQALSLARNFDRFFSIPELKFAGNTIDFTREISLMGCKVRTNFGMVLELEAIRNYNKHYQLKDGDVVFDCGAFHGIYALFASPQVGNKGRIYCFEPDEENAKILSWNLERNNIRNAVLVKKGIWKEGGKVWFLGSQAEISSLVLDSFAKSGTSSVEVVSIPLFLRQRNLTDLNFVKMDIEGAEVEAVEGCLGYLRDHKVNFGIASYHLRGGQETYHALEPLFKKAGYESVTDVTDTITTYAWPQGAKP